MKWGLRRGMSRPTKFTQKRVRPSFKSVHSFYQKIDQLPHGPGFEQHVINVTGDRTGPKRQPLTEKLEVWVRDPLECIAEILRNLRFQGCTADVPRQVFADSTKGDRECSGMNTADWWWETQLVLPDGATIVPVIIASNETRLTNFSGNKTAWPIYITVSNIDKSVRRKPSEHTTILLGYLLTSNLKVFSKDLRTSKGNELFHICMKEILEPLVHARNEGVSMLFPGGGVRWAFPILAAYIADFPEQCLVTCTKQSCCPKCKVALSEQGTHRCNMPPLRGQREALTILQHHHKGWADAKESLADQGLHPVYPPFWANLPHTDIFSCTTPDLLHQIHKGVFKDYLLAWCQTIIGAEEMDRRFQTMPSHPSVRRFSSGISGFSQWGGTKSKDVEKVFLGIISGAVRGSLMTAARALMDFIQLAQYPAHTDKTLKTMDITLAKFHRHKDAFVEAGARELPHFDIPKLHSLFHYTTAIRLLGTLDGFNMECPERLHIDFAKKAYTWSSKHDYTKQMACWLNRQEAIIMLQEYLAWQGINLRTACREDPNPAVDDADRQPEDEHLQMFGSLQVKLAKAPPFCHLTADVLSRHFGAAHFLRCLDDFISTLPPPCQQHRLYLSNQFEAFKHVQLLIPSLGRHNEPFLDKVRASPSWHSDIPKATTSVVRFDMVLIRMTGAAGSMDARGYRIAQVCAIFLVPPTIAYVNQPIAYVEWFSIMDAMESELPAGPLNLQNAESSIMDIIWQDANRYKTRKAWIQRVDGIELIQCGSLLGNSYLTVKDIIEHIDHKLKWRVLEEEQKQGRYRCRVWNSEGVEIAQPSAAQSEDQHPPTSTRHERLWVTYPVRIKLLDDYASKWDEIFEQAASTSLERQQKSGKQFNVVVGRFFTVTPPNLDLKLVILPHANSIGALQLEEADWAEMFKAANNHDELVLKLKWPPQDSEKATILDHVRFSTHPLNFYSTWVDSASLNLLVLLQTGKQGWLRPVPKVDDVLNFNDLLMDTAPHAGADKTNTQVPTEPNDDYWFQGDKTLKFERLGTDKIMGAFANVWAKEYLGWELPEQPLDSSQEEIPTTEANNEITTTKEPKKPREPVIAEWLHRLGHGHNNATTDRFTNLIFGTSECNTDMIRYVLSSFLSASALGERGTKALIVKLGLTRRSVISAEAMVSALLKSKKVYCVSVKTQCTGNNVVEMLSGGELPSRTLVFPEYKYTELGMYVRWLMPELAYTITWKTMAVNTPQGGPHTTFFHPFSRRRPLKVEYKLDHQVLKRYLATIDISPASQALLNERVAGRLTDEVDEVKYDEVEHPSEGRLRRLRPGAQDSPPELAEQSDLDGSFDPETESVLAIDDQDARDFFEHYGKGREILVWNVDDTTIEEETG
ncbi:hypothetical protein BOTBODRAFT_178865 [Botryobasidium botryosum FD-172 SS1]|uniref:Uncharacterized protein n=1 Tax=Botryobasidium botryosum (strain FD-172 SS1) TaxID=930990 RepID=A0A067MCM7_BOTB1|nr:hypothetical protein BOTBODRAFT_178865 [Botryobasidium botryosum FD-172 SS1]